jgi:hypothetical protein
MPLMAVFNRRLSDSFPELIATSNDALTIDMFRCVFASCCVVIGSLVLFLVVWLTRASWAGMLLEIGVDIGVLSSLAFVDRIHSY